MSEKAPELKPGHPAERAIYATRDGRLCEEDDPEASELVVGAGGVVTEKMAARYGKEAQAGKAVPSDAVPAAGKVATPAHPPAEREPERPKAPKADDEDEDEGSKGHRVSKK